MLSGVLEGVIIFEGRTRYTARCVLGNLSAAQRGYPQGRVISVDGTAHGMANLVSYWFRGARRGEGPLLGLV